MSALLDFSSSQLIHGMSRSMCQRILLLYCLGSLNDQRYLIFAQRWRRLWACAAHLTRPWSYSLNALGPISFSMSGWLNDIFPSVCELGLESYNVSSVLSNLGNFKFRFVPSFRTTNTRNTLTTQHMCSVLLVAYTLPWLLRKSIMLLLYLLLVVLIVMVEEVTTIVIAITRILLL